MSWQQVSFPSQVYEGSNNSLHCIRTVPALSLKILSSVHLHSESAELVGCHSRPPEWPCIAKDNDCHGYVKGLECLCQDDLWSQISHFQSVKPGLIWGLLITVRQFGEVSINAPVIAFYSYCRDKERKWSSMAATGWWDYNLLLCIK